MGFHTQCHQHDCCCSIRAANELFNLYYLFVFISNITYPAVRFSFAESQANYIIARCNIFLVNAQLSNRHDPGLIDFWRVFSLARYCRILRVIQGCSASGVCPAIISHRALCMRPAQTGRPGPGCRGSSVSSTQAISPGPWAAFSSARSSPLPSRVTSRPWTSRHRPGSSGCRPGSRCCSYTGKNQRCLEVAPEQACGFSFT